MRRSQRFEPQVEGAETRLSLSGMGGAIARSAEQAALRHELENTMISSITAPPRPQGGQQIIAILIGL